MENQTRFDLNAAVENWRNELAAQPNLASDDRRELETHLRDAIAGFQQRGLNDEESFWLARRRVGQPQQIGEEFIKANPAAIWRERVFWMVLVFFLLGTLGNIPYFLSTLFSTPESGMNLPSVIFITLLRLSPLIVAVLLGAGKMTRQFSNLMQLISGRFRLAFVALILILISSVLEYFTIAISQRHWEAMQASIGMHALLVHNGVSFEQLLPTVVAKLILAFLLIWLMPTQNQKTPKRA
jgi:hypothetical protein